MENYIYKDGTLKVNIEVIEEGMFSNFNIKKLILSDSVKEIKPYAFYNNNIEEIIFNNNLEIIGNSSFENNNITNINIPKNVKKIGKKAFKNNNIETLCLINNTDNIEISCYENNKIKNLIIQDDIVEIKDKAFKDNQIENIKLTNKIENIGKEAFRNNRIKSLVLPNSIKKIEDKAFYQAGIENIKLSYNLKEIKDEAFKYNRITNLDLNNNLEIIGKAAFEENRIDKININDNLKTIKEKSFYNNNILNLELPNNIVEIKDEAFNNNPLLKVNQNSEIIKYGKNVFNTKELYINNELYSKDFLKKYNTNNIDKIIKINKQFNNFNFDILDMNDLNYLPDTVESINGFKANYKKYNELYKYALTKYKFSTIKNKDSKEYKAFFNLCYILGIFSTGGEELNCNIETTKKIIDLYTISQLTFIFYNINELKYYKKFKNIINDYVNDPNLDYFTKFINKLYNEFKEIQKSIHNKKKYEFYILTNLYKEHNDKKIKEEICYLKKDLKNISYINVKEYFNNSIFQIKKENKQLEEIAYILSSYVVIQNDFNKIQKIYEKYDKSLEYKYFQKVEDLNNNDITYEWLNGNDPKNFILGYIVNCCAKINGLGEDIMIQSVLNPSIKNIVVYDKSKNIIGKSTAFYNSSNKYILCNNIQMSQKFMSSNKTSNKDRIGALNAFKRALLEQKDAMEDNNIPVDEIRIGMGNNGLKDVIESENIEIQKNNLLDNYKYKNHNGDANCKQTGQALIYKKRR